MMNSARKHSLNILILKTLVLLSVKQQISNTSSGLVEAQESSRGADGVPAPAPLPGASYLTQDCLNLVVLFDRPVNLSASIGPLNEPWSGSESVQELDVCSVEDAWYRMRRVPLLESASSQRSVQGIHLCAQLLTKKTLKFLHKFKPRNCFWATRLQFVVELSRQVPASKMPVKVAFQRHVLAPYLTEDTQQALTNEREAVVELNRLPLELLGVPLSPRLALTGPTQVPPCGLFTMTAHLWSPYGTEAGEAVSLKWDISRIGADFNSNGQAPNGSTIIESLEVQELRWQTLKRLVSSIEVNSLVLDSQLLQFVPPQLYEFHISATFTTPAGPLVLNATHKLNRLDFETPIGTIYGTHILQDEVLVNPSKDLLLLAEVRVPECAANAKQVGLYWQVSDTRVKFEQTYAPYYLARAGSLPESSLLEFRLNLFYGMRVKRYASTSVFINTGEPQLDARISNGALALATGMGDGNLELFASPGTREPVEQLNSHAYLWSCFDGKTGQPCRNKLAAMALNSRIQPSNTSDTRYELSTAFSGRQPTLASEQEAGSLLVDRKSQSQPALRLSLSKIEPEAQLWFGLQRFERHLPAPQQKQLSEYTLVNFRSNLRNVPTISIGPVLVGRARHRATPRNPLSGAVMLVAGVPAVIIGRIWPREMVKAFTWRSANNIQPLNWIQRNATNQLTGQKELVTELHLNPNLQLALGHHQIQLIACSKESSTPIEVNLSLDVVASVKQCQVRPSLNTLNGALMISVDHCNIPLGLSPISYQVYLVDNKFLQGIPDEPDDLSEADEFQLESHAEPLSVPQLSPVFAFDGLSVATLASMLGTSETNRIRIATRVCDKLHSCKMFYSIPLSIATLQGSISNQLKAINQTAGTIGEQHPEDLSVWLKSMLEKAWRVNKAGSSVGAISVVNGAMTLALRGLGAVKNERALNDQLQAAVRDLLQYSLMSIQRQFQYTDSGQANLVLSALAKPLSIPRVGLETKFKTIKIIAQLVKRTINQQVSNHKINCLADFRVLQATFESLLSTFSNYHATTEPTTSGDREKGSKTGFLSFLNNHTQAPVSATPVLLTTAEKGSLNRKKRETIVLTYLKSVRLALKSLISVAAMQLPLGDSHQFRYSSSRNLLDQNNSPQSPGSSSEAFVAVTSPKSSALQQESSVTSGISSSSSSSEISSLLTHLSHLNEEPLEVDLAEFGSVSLIFNRRFVERLRSKIDGNQLQCRNSTLSVTCFSFILSITTYAGKSPFRSLDESLRVPLVEVDLLSPEDGSNLLEYSQNNDLAEALSIQISFQPVRQQNAQLNENQTNFRCYQFEEASDNWMHGSSRDSLPSSNEPFKCTYNRLGAFATFRGQPVSNEESLSVAALTGIGVAVTVFFLLLLCTCCSDSEKKGKRSSARDVSDYEDEDIPCPMHTRHPEQNYRTTNRYPKPI